jgi:hypothetical protein
MATLPALITAAPATAQAASIDRSEWDRKFAALERKRAETSAASAAETAARTRYEAARPSPDMVDMHAFHMMRRDEVARCLDVEKYWRRYLSSEGQWWFSPNPEACKARTRASIDSVLEFRRLDAEAERATGYAAASETYERLATEECDLHTALIQTPAPDAEALLWKLEELFGEVRGEDRSCDPWTGVLVEPVMADARRLLSRGRA